MNNLKFYPFSKLFFFFPKVLNALEIQTFSPLSICRNLKGTHSKRANVGSNGCLEGPDPVTHLGKR